MWKLIDRGAAVLLGLAAAVGHSLGSFAAYHDQPLVLLWALSASAFGALLGALHLLRSFRPGDRALAAVAIVGAVAWMAMCIGFGVLIGRPGDPRVLIFLMLSLVLIGFSLRSAVSARPPVSAFA